MSEFTGGIEADVRRFADEVTVRILTCLEGEPKPDELTVRASADGKRYAFTYRQTLHAAAAGPAVGMLKAEYALGTDRSGSHLAVHTSSFQLLDTRGKKPLVRFEYVRDANRVPCSHVHVHAESGLFTQLLAATGHDTPAAIQSVHFPTGGDRFRPCVEDFIEFLVVECHVLPREGWRELVVEGREEWRAKQTAAAVRDRPDIAIEILERLGVTVSGDLIKDRPSARSRF